MFDSPCVPRYSGGILASFFGFEFRALWRGVVWLGIGFLAWKKLLGVSNKREHSGNGV